MKSIAIKDRLISPIGQEWVVDQIDDDAALLVCEPSGTRVWWTFDALDEAGWENKGPGERT